MAREGKGREGRGGEGREGRAPPIFYCTPQFQFSRNMPGLQGLSKNFCALLVQDFFYRPDALSVIQPTLSKHALRNIIKQSSCCLKKTYIINSQNNLVTIYITGKLVRYINYSCT